MLENGLAAHLLSQVGKTVTPLVQEGLVNLVDISGKDHLCALSGAAPPRSPNTAV